MFQLGKLELVDVAFAQVGAIDREGEVIGREGESGELERLGIGLRAAVGGVVEIGVAASGEGVRGERRGVDREREGEAEALREELEFLDFERGFAGPDEALDAVGAIAVGVPAAVGFAGDEGAIGEEIDAQDAALEAVRKGKAGALVLAVHFFEEDAIDAGEDEFAHEELVFGGAEFPPGEVAAEAGRALAHLHVGEPDGRRAVTGNLFDGLGGGDILRERTGVPDRRIGPASIG